MVHRLAARAAIGIVVKRTTGAQQVPDFPGNTMHIDRQTNSAVANKGKPKFFFAHRRGVTAQNGRGKSVARQTPIYGENARLNRVCHIETMAQLPIINGLLTV